MKTTCIKIYFLVFFGLFSLVNISNAQNYESIQSLFPDYDGYGGELFGNDMVLNGDYMAVTMPGLLDSKKIIVLKKVASQWTKIAALDVLDTNKSQNLYVSRLFMNDTLLMLGIPYYSKVQAQNTGRILIYKKQGLEWTDAITPTVLELSTPLMNAAFGSDYVFFNKKLYVGMEEFRKVYIYNYASGNWSYEDEIAIDTAYGFGSSLDVNDSLLLVGSRLSNNLSGAAYLFKKNGGTWDKDNPIFIEANDGSLYDNFGSFVKISNNKLFVSAPYEDSLNSGFSNTIGAIYIFDYNGISVNQLAKLTPGYINVSYLKMGAAFSVLDSIVVAKAEAGIGLYLFKNNNGTWSDAHEFAFLKASANLQLSSYAAADHVMYCAYNAYSDSSSYYNTGAVMAFDKPAQGFVSSEQPDDTLSLFDVFPKGYNATYDYFGTNIDISGNIAVVGVPNDDRYGKNAGIAYVFEFDGSQWNKIANLSSSDRAAEHEFGASVAIDSNTIVIGASHAGAAVAAGKVYIFEKPLGSWVTATETAQLTPSNPQSYKYFGSKVAIDQDVIVASNVYGEVYLFQKPLGAWTNATETAKLISSDLNSNDYFGCEIKIKDTIIVIGAKNKLGTNQYDGAAYLFIKPSAGWTNITETAKFTSSVSNYGMQLGQSIAIHDDKIFISAVGYMENNIRKGAVLVYNKQGNNWVSATESQIVTMDEIENYDSFGNSIVISKNNLLVGCPNKKIGENYGNGKVFIFKITTNGLLYHKAINSPDMIKYQNFGSALAADGTHFLATNPASSIIGDSEGHISVFKISESPYVSQIITDIIIPEDHESMEINLSDVFDDVTTGDSITINLLNVSNTALAQVLFDDSLTLSIQPFADSSGFSAIVLQATDKLGHQINDTINLIIRPLPENFSLQHGNNIQYKTLEGGFSILPHISDLGNLIFYKITTTEGLFYLNDSLTPINNCFINAQSLNPDFLFWSQIVGEAQWQVTATYDSTWGAEYAVIAFDTFMVNKKPLYVIPADTFRLYGYDNPQFRLIYNGFAEDENLSVLNVLPSAVTSATITSDADIYDVYSQGGLDDHYVFAHDTAVLNVNKALLIATPADTAIIHGSPIPVFQIEYSGFLNNDDENDLDVLPLASTTATTSSPLGNYPITLSGGMDNNYEFDLQEGILTIGDEGIYDNSSIHVSIYPNPAKESIKINGLQIDDKVMLVNSKGNVLLNDYLSGNRSISLEPYKSGAYFIYIIRGNRTTTIPFIKE